MNVRKVDFKDVVRINMKDLYFQFSFFFIILIGKKTPKMSAGTIVSCFYVSVTSFVRVAND